TLELGAELPSLRHEHSSWPESAFLQVSVKTGENPGQKRTRSDRGACLLHPGQFNFASDDAESQRQYETLIGCKSTIAAGPGTAHFDLPQRFADPRASTKSAMNSSTNG
ncbi:hypothetical protein ACPEH7_18330, partial [Stenotrophomonas sp. NPDC101269]|uniref:hypothetical protein n=1 Tax=Stenotrophomonas sp. NPDC101269 TaxID=3415003 RepID=UPI003C2FDEAF